MLWKIDYISHFMLMLQNILLLIGLEISEQLTNSCTPFVKLVLLLMEKAVV